MAPKKQPGDAGPRGQTAKRAQDVTRRGFQRIVRKFAKVLLQPHSPGGSTVLPHAHASHVPQVLAFQELASQVGQQNAQSDEQHRLLALFMLALWHGEDPLTPAEINEVRPLRQPLAPTL